MDYGCYYDGYCSDMTRTIAVGEPAEKLKEIYQITLDAQLKVIDSLKPGMTGMKQMLLHVIILLLLAMAMHLDIL